MMSISRPRMTPAPMSLLVAAAISIAAVALPSDAHAHSLRPAQPAHATIVSAASSLRSAHHDLKRRSAALKRCRRAAPRHHAHRRACALQLRELRHARVRLGRARTRLSQFRATTGRVDRRTAPTISVDGKTVIWTSVAGVNRYVLATRIPGDATTYTTVYGTSATPAGLPGTTVSYSVRTDIKASKWSREVSISYPAPTVTPSSPPPSNSQESTSSSQATPESQPEYTPIAAEEPVHAPEAPTISITGTTYYVSPDGSDSNSGTSPSSAWRTVTRVNRAHLEPGDGVLFEAGATFSDETLMPASSGAPGKPIVFGSYGAGNATLPLGVWFKGNNFLTFTHLSIGPEGNLQGTGDGITVATCSIGNDGLAINATGANSDWTIIDNTINHTGNSGMLLEGDIFMVAGNTITNTGLDSSIPYPRHGIYLKVSNATVIDNTITNFSSDGISARYRNSIISGNHISDGEIGIAWFQYDAIAGTSRWTDNAISGTTAAGVYVSPSDPTGGETRESFAISGNTIQITSGVYFNLHSTTGTYSIGGNALD